MINESDCTIKIRMQRVNASQHPYMNLKSKKFVRNSDFQRSKEKKLSKSGESKTNVCMQIGYTFFDATANSCSSAAAIMIWNDFVAH